MPYAIMRFAKRKHGAINSMQAHNEREKEAYKSNPDINLDRKKENYHIIEPKHKYYAEIMFRVEKAGCKVRKDSVLMVETMITASPEFMTSLPAGEQKEYFEHAMRFISQEVSEENIFAATIHMDERTPHMHVCFTPITPEGKLSAKTVLGNQKKLSEWQSRFHEHMSARWSQLERGISAMETQRKHIPVWYYKKAQRMDMMIDNVRQALADINILNAGKKRDEALATLAKWKPEAEKFTAQIKNYQGYIDQLENGNTVLKDKLKEKNEKFENLFTEAIHLKQAVEKQKRLLEKVPKDILENINIKSKDFKQR